MNMTGFQAACYGTSAVSHRRRSAVSRTDNARATGKASQVSFSQMAATHLKLGYAYANVDLVTGQELYMNYDESSTEEDPVILAEGIDINGNSFQEKIHLNEIDVSNASIVEMTALNLHLGKKGDSVIKSHYSFALETLSSQYNLTSKMNFEQYFHSYSGKLQTAGYRQEAKVYKNELERYLFFQKSGQLNRKADGTGTLTEEQISYLKEKYDVENLTEKEYYNLLEELSEMNILSGKEVETRLARQEPPHTYMIMPAYEGGFIKDQDFGGNYLLKLQKEIDYTEFVLDMIRQGKCQAGPENALGAIRKFYEKEQEYNRKIEGIFKQL